MTLVMTRIPVLHATFAGKAGASALAKRWERSRAPAGDQRNRMQIA